MWIDLNDGSIFRLCWCERIMAIGDVPHELSLFIVHTRDKLYLIVPILEKPTCSMIWLILHESGIILETDLNLI